MTVRFSNQLVADLIQPFWAGLIYAHLAANGSRPALHQREVTGRTMSELVIPEPKPVVLSVAREPFHP